MTFEDARPALGWAKGVIDKILYPLLVLAVVGAVSSVGGFINLSNQVAEHSASIARHKTEYETRTAEERQQRREEVARLSTQVEILRAYDSRIAVLESSLPRIERKLDSIDAYIRDLARRGNP
jgi:hypothetical protein